MSAAPALPLNGSAGVNAGLKRYAELLSAPRRHRQRALGKDVDPDYCFTDFLFAVSCYNEKRLTRVYQAERTKSPLGEGSGIAGGYLVPLALRLDLMADVGEEALIRPRASVVDMPSANLELSLPDAGTAQAAGVSPFFGGMLMQWTAENALRPETEPKFRSVTLRAWDLTGYCIQSRPHYFDSGPGVENWLRKLFARSIAWYEDYAYFQGTGSGMPVGIINSAAAKTVSRHAPTVFDNPNDVASMTKALMPGSWQRALWVISPSVWSQIVTLGGAAAGASPSFQINQPIIGSRDLGDLDKYGLMPLFTLAGVPGYISEKLPPLGTKGDVILIDPQLYVIGDRGAVEIIASPHEPTAFKNNQQVWRVTYRGDGQPWLSTTVTLQDGTTTVSPFVVLV